MKAIKQLISIQFLVFMIEINGTSAKYPMQNLLPRRLFRF